MTETVIIINPNSGGGQTDRQRPALERRLREIFDHPRILSTTHRGHAVDLAANAASTHVETVIAIGGDGTINEVVNGLMAVVEEHRPTLGVFTSGTGGDFRRTHGLPLKLADQMNCLAAGSVAAIDIGQVDFTDFQGQPASRYIANIGSFGMSGEVCAQVNSAGLSKKLGGKTAFRLASLRCLMTYRNQPVNIRYGSEQMVGPVNTASVCIGKYFGGGMAIAPDAVADDGLFDVVVLGDLKRFDAILSMGQIYRGTHLDHPQVAHFRTDHLTATPLGTEPVKLEIDGESPGVLPARFKIHRHALKLIGANG